MLTGTHCIVYIQCKTMLFIVYKTMPSSSFKSSVTQKQYPIKGYMNGNLQNVNL